MGEGLVGGGGAAELTPDRFAALYRESTRALWCIAMSVLKDRASAEDVVQDAAMIALAKRREFEPGTSFTAWVGQIVRFTALNEHRRRRREEAGRLNHAGAAFATSEPPPPPTGADDSTWRGMEPALARALDTLDETPRTCLLMRTVMNMGYREIAAGLGIPEGTAMSHVHRARQALRAKLAAEGAKGAAS